MLKMERHNRGGMTGLLTSLRHFFSGRHNAVLEDALNSFDMALIFFNLDGTLRTANCRACELIPQLCGGEGNSSWKCCRYDGRPVTHHMSSCLPSQIRTFQDFISYVYDNSIDEKDQSGLFIETKSGGAAFREIIALPDGLFYLVRAIPQGSKGTIVELSDISDLKARADHLYKIGQENRILNEAIQTSLKGIFIAENRTEAQQLLFCNLAMNDLLGFDCQDFIGKNLDEFLFQVFPDDCGKLDDVLYKAASKGHVWGMRLDADGNLVWLELTLLRSGQDDNLLVGFLSDETQTKMQENRLLQTQKLEAIGQLAGGVAHDFNNILAIMEGYARMSESAWKRGEDISPHLNKIYQAVQRGSGLTRQLLLFGKHRVGEGRTIDLGSQVRETQTLLSPLMGAQIRLDILSDGGPHYIKATPDSISQIVMNLSINARDAMPKGGKLTIEVQESVRDYGRKGSMLLVSDTGIGISPEIISKIFDPFFTTKEQGKGSGLGLSMVYGLVQQLKGELNVESGIGEGSTFSIWFPESDNIPESAQSANNASGFSEGDALAGKTVVLAEDEPDLLEIMKTTLEGFGMNVLKAANGNEALEVQDEYEGKIDFLLTDMVMPELGGLQLAELFHEVRPDTHVVFMSGYPVRGEIADIELPDDAVFLAKPVKHENLKKIMQQVALRQKVQSVSGVVWEV